MMGPATIRQNRISYIIAVRDGASTIKQTLDSLGDQRGADVQVIVVDGASSDATMSIVDRHPVVTCVESRPDSGIYQAWNRGLRHATGEWISFLGADDRLPDPGTARSLLTEAVRAREAGYSYVYGGCILESSNGKFRCHVSKKVDLTKGLDLPSHPGSLHHRTLIDRLGGFDEKFRIAGDLDLLARMWQDCPGWFVPDVDTAVRQLGGVSTNARFIRRVLAEHQEIQTRYGLPGGRLQRGALLAGHYFRGVLWSTLPPQVAASITDGVRLLFGLDRMWTRRP